jgi:phosphoribosylformimino-5-aminoimidazole carboxamide ribotide isomerase
MIILPAIDIKQGRVIRLFKGQFDKVTDYGADPLSMAKHWEDMGAPYLHVVDLDGAESGNRINQSIICRIAQDLKIPVETGGGIRSHETIREYMQAGISRVILGTRVVSDRDFLKRALADWGERIAVSIDCSNGFVAQRGWQETSSVKGIDLAREFSAMGLQYIIYTDIARDGTLEGPNITGLLEILDNVSVNVIASGGIKDESDIKTLSALKRSNLYGVITGKAIYEGKLDLKHALGLCQ